MKKSIVFLFILSIMLTLTGCENYFRDMKNIVDVAFARIVGIDKTTDGTNGINLTIVYPVMQTSKGKTEMKSISKIVSMQGATVIDALNNFSLTLKKSPYLGHTGYIIIGEESAKDDVKRYLDAFFRNPEVRLNAKVLIAKNSTAREFLENSWREDELISDYLDVLYNDIYKKYESSEVRIIDIMQQLENQYIAACIPVVYINNAMPEFDKKVQYIVLSGLAILKKGKLVDYMNGSQVKGFNFIKNLAGLGPIIIEEPAGNKISLTIIEFECKTTPQFINDEIKIKIEIKFSTNAIEQQGDVDIYNEKTLKLIQKKQEEWVRKITEDAIDFAKKNKADVFGISDFVYHKYPLKWESIKDNWENIFPTLPYKIEINSKINMTYNITQPIGAKKEKG